MGRATIIIKRDLDRERACAWINKAPINTRIEFKASKRSVPQNDRMWAMLGEIAEQVEWAGKKRRTDDWKLLFLDALEREYETVPNLDGDGLVKFNQRSSDLSKEEMSDMIELIFKFGAERGVEFNET